MKKEIEEFLYKNTTAINESDITNYQLFALKRRNILVSFMITVIICGIGIGLCFVEAYVGTAIIIAGIVGGVILFPYLSKEQIRRQNSVLFDGGKHVNIFEFYKEEIKVINVDENRGEDLYQTFSYNQIYKIDDFVEFLFIYVSKNQSFLMLKTGMNKGTISDLLEFLKSKDIKIEDKTSLGTLKKK